MGAVEQGKVERSDVGEPHGGAICDLPIEGMHCAACTEKVRAGLLALPGVHEVQVSPGLRRARVRWSPGQTSLEHMHAAIRQSGYIPHTVDSLALLDARRATARVAMWRWLVAALCMMQVMMYAYPAYIAEPGTLEPDQEQLLRLACWALTLPVLLFSCLPIWRQAWQDARQGRVGMDTPVALAIAITFLVSSAGTFDPDSVLGRDVYFDSLTMFVFFLLSARWLESRLRDRTGGALDVLAGQLPLMAQRVRRAGDAAALAQPEHVMRADLRVGDWIQVRAGEVFATDGVLEGGQTQVNEALLTGEAMPVTLATGDRVVAGSSNLSASVRVRVTAIGPDTRFAQIARVMESAALTRPKVLTVADRVAGLFLLAVLLLAAGVAVWHWAEGPSHALMLAVTVLIVTCPCALSLAAPSALIAACGNLARRGVLVQNLQAIETMAKVDTVLFDKTGTLTEDRLEVKSVEASRRIGRGRAIELAAAMASESLHPIAKALQRLHEANTDAPPWSLEQVEEHTGQGVSAQAQLAGRTQRMRMGSAEFCGLTNAPATTGPVVYLADAEGWLATFALSEVVRADAHAAIQRLHGAGLATELLSGDKATTVKGIAQVLGIGRAQGNCSPQQKLARAQELQASGHHVAMVGDGLNDGPALSGSTVSVAMGHALDVAKAKSSFILQGNALEALPDLVVLARKTMRVMRQNLLWAAGYNAVCVPLAVMGVFSPWAAGLGMAASSLLVAANAARLASTAQTRPTSNKD
jgi:P-type Cu2+ transporter